MENLEKSDEAADFIEFPNFVSSSSIVDSAFFAIKPKSGPVSRRLLNTDKESRCEIVEEKGGKIRTKETSKRTVTPDTAGTM